jgi:hypothetical protein
MLKMKSSNLCVMICWSCLLPFTGCDDELKDPVIPNEEELITTLTYRLIPTEGGETVVLTYKDLDGDGPGEAIVSVQTLSALTSYNGVLDLLNESQSPSSSITEEIEEEAIDHQFFFENTFDDWQIQYADTDFNGQPIGLSTLLTTGVNGTGSLTITLRHEPDKNGTGVGSGDMTLAGGETDIAVTFLISVQ